MIGALLRQFLEIWFIDFEFWQPPGERPIPICMVARELRSGRVVRLWLWGVGAIRAPPFPTGDDILFIAFLVSAEVSCFIELNWPVPKWWLDLFAEFRCYSNGNPAIEKHGLLDALRHFGTKSSGNFNKAEMRQLAARGGPYTPQERAALLDYCLSDVDDLVLLLPLLGDCLGH